MKKIREDKPCYGLSVKFAPGVDFDHSDGRIISLYLKTRKTSVPLIVVADDSEAKRNGQDGIFALCSENCANKMKEIVTKELEFFSGESSMVRL
ncbi:hypothetical protein J2T17_007650 [Paenibacillus mucilaginosus]|uniref:hypothetical protein n=1 Tax=Paenibacillus mucilaginosus TaxID=61624 RepID=UPI003D23979D